MTKYEKNSILQASITDAFFLVKYVYESQSSLHRVAKWSNEPLILDQYYEGGMKIVVFIHIVFY